MKTKLLKSAVFAAIAVTSFNASAVLVNGSVLNFTAYNGAGAIPADGNGSWFVIEPASTGVVGISSFNGLIVGTTQEATGSHGGVPDGSESPTIDNPHEFFYNTGMLGTVSDTNILTSTNNTATLDFSGIRWSWAGTDNIVIYAPAQGDSGVATITCALDCGNGDSYMLDYFGHVQLGSPAGIGGEEFFIHLEGTISTVPVPAAAWLFGSGLLGLIGVARRKKALL